MSQADLRVLANLLSISAQTFQQLAAEAAETKDETAYSILKTRYDLSSEFAEKLVAAYRMPEPVSRDFH
jgi:hypothetical protein